MSYIGNTATQQAFTPAVDFFNGNGSTTAFTLSRPVASVAQVQVVISNVPQKPGDAYTVSGNTITFTSAPPSGTQNIYVYYTSPITQVIAPGQGTVGTAQIQNGAVIPADLSTGAPTWDTSGNVSLTGSAPSAWSSSSQALQNGSGALWRFSGSIYLGQNYFFNGTNRIYSTSDFATEYEQRVGQHRWFTAPSGTAGNAISFTQAMAVGHNQTLALQGATPQSGTGITFPAAQSASSDVNTLDDYEEGTWTPSVGGNATYTIQAGTYIKIGQLVTVWFDVSISTIGTGATTTLTGLPFTSRSSPTFPQGMSGSVGYFNALANGITNIFVRTDNASTFVYFGNTTGSNNTTLAGAALFQNSARITGTLTYQSNA